MEKYLLLGMLPFVWESVHFCVALFSGNATGKHLLFLLLLGSVVVITGQSVPEEYGLLLISLIYSVYVSYFISKSCEKREQSYFDAAYMLVSHILLTMLIFGGSI